MSTDKCALFSISDQPGEYSDPPVYKIDHVYDTDETVEDDKAKQPKPRSRNCCWNCGDNGHALRQCPLPPNHGQINKNRAMFATRNEFKRYHVDIVERGDKFPHLLPGVISDKLREALGIVKDQLPPHIYKMRSLGYPPGWLLEAQVDSSGIEMFDIEGNRVPNADEEEGEIGLSLDYNEKKIITYPGFNAWPDPGTIDETREYGAPELRYLQNKEQFIKSLNKQNLMPYTGNTKVNFNEDSNDCDDMETEDVDEVRLLPEDSRCTFIPPLPEDTDYPPPPPPPIEDGEIMEGPPGDDSEGSDDTCSLPNESTDSKPEVDQFQDMSHGRVVSIDLGTPSLKIHSPFQKLPPPECFRKDISDVINFENLPDSTGAYEKLKGVLKNVRSKMSVLKEGKMNATI